MTASVDSLIDDYKKFSEDHPLRWPKVYVAWYELPDLDHLYPGWACWPQDEGEDGRPHIETSLASMDKVRAEEVGFWRATVPYGLGDEVVLHLAETLTVGPDDPEVFRSRFLKLLELLGEGGIQWSSPAVPEADIWKALLRSLRELPQEVLAQVLRDYEVEAFRQGRAGGEDPEVRRETMFLSTAYEEGKKQLKGDSR